MSDATGMSLHLLTDEFRGEQFHPSKGLEKNVRHRTFRGENGTDQHIGVNDDPQHGKLPCIGTTTRI